MMRGVTFQRLFLAFGTVLFLFDYGFFPEDANASPAVGRTSQNVAVSPASPVGAATSVKDGVVVALNHDGRVALKLNSAQGELTATFLTTEKDTPLLLDDASITLNVYLDGAGEEGVTPFVPVDLFPDNTDASGGASLFSGRSDDLKGLQSFQGELTGIHLNGKALGPVRFWYGARTG